ncbi:hypothetical protein LOK49_LG01G02440 [Camellia lanceoleosa]|uniref:Uncharacterized protein n=1 Tax=Camellia lanceoleosa TaxID=1840588 RepID=A0ACC0IWZ9_9ERIC|nr:hypothetical protein LOK49_LG01G02440 [Camellia lanceoleosa]
MICSTSVCCHLPVNKNLPLFPPPIYYSPLFTIHSSLSLFLSLSYKVCLTLLFFSSSNISYKSEIRFPIPMEDRKEKNTPWLSVPQFGDWDQKGVMPDYSLDFSKIRENRKQNKRDVSRASLGNEEELISSTTATANSAHHDHQHHHFHQDHSPTTRRSFLSYFNCCVKA